MNFMHFDWSTLIATYIGTNVIAYALKTVPIVDNVWAKWIIGVIQYAFSNSEIGKLNFQKPEDPK